MAARPTLLCLSLLAFVACDGGGAEREHREREHVHEAEAERVAEAEREVEATPEPEPLPEDGADPPSCTLSHDDAVVLDALPATVRAAAIAVSGERTFVVAATGEALEVATRNGDELARATVPLRSASTLLALEPVDGERAIAIGQIACPESEAAPRCLVGVLLGPDAAGIGEPLVVALPAEIRTRRVASAGRSAYVVRSHAHAPPAIDVLDAGPRGLTHRRIALGEGLALADEAVEVMGFAVSDGAWAVLYRHGAPEDARSAVVLATHMDEHEVEPLHDALVVESFAWSAGALSLIVSLEFARPSLIRLGADGELRGSPALLRRGDELPPPFTGRRTSLVRGSGASALIEVRDGSGDRIAEIPIGDERFVFADLAATEDGFRVAVLEEGGESRRARLASLTCAR